MPNQLSSSHRNLIDPLIQLPKGRHVAYVRKLSRSFHGTPIFQLLPYNLQSSFVGLHDRKIQHLPNVPPAPFRYQQSRYANVHHSHYELIGNVARVDLIDRSHKRNVGVHALRSSTHHLVRPNTFHQSYPQRPLAIPQCC